MESIHQLKAMEVGELLKLKEDLLKRAKAENDKLEYIKLLGDLHRVMKEIEGR